MCARRLLMVLPTIHPERTRPEDRVLRENQHLLDSYFIVNRMIGFAAERRAASLNPARV